MSEFDPKTLEGHTPKMDEVEKKKTVKKKTAKKKVVQKADVVYSFPSRSRCPRCGSAGTSSYSTDKDKQYRKCQGPLCRKNYCVIGEAI